MTISYSPLVQVSALTLPKIQFILELSITGMENNGDKITILKNELVNAVHFLNSKGWLPVNSGNFSFRVPGESKFWISCSGADKLSFTTDDLILIDPQGEPIEDKIAKAPPETTLHILLYENPDVNAVFHTHSVSSTVISSAHRNEGEVKLSNYELLKELSGINTHDTTVSIPVFTNMQDMRRLSPEVRRYMRGRTDFRAFLLSGHGLHTWGKSISDAKRHSEALEFLLECEIKLQLYANQKFSR